jgi:hypothetical protein
VALSMRPDVVPGAEYREPPMWTSAGRGAWGNTVSHQCGPPCVSVKVYKSDSSVDKRRVWYAGRHRDPSAGSFLRVLARYSGVLAAWTSAGTPGGTSMALLARPDDVPR